MEEERKRWGREGGRERGRVTESGYGYGYGHDMDMVTPANSRVRKLLAFMLENGNRGLKLYQNQSCRHGSLQSMQAFQGEGGSCREARLEGSIVRVEAIVIASDPAAPKRGR